MKTLFQQATALITAILCCAAAQGALSFTYSDAPVAIPDNDASGVGFGFSLSDVTTSIESVTVTLDISGGHNGDLYAYLSHGDGFAVLLNRVGVGETTSGSSSLGYADTGFALTLTSVGAASAHFYQNHSPTYNGSGQLVGAWRPDGRGIDPESAPSAFDAEGSADFGSFDGVNPNGAWTLFISDLSPGSISTLNSFSVDVTAIEPVPEPINVALGIFAGMLAVAGVVRRVVGRTR